MTDTRETALERAARAFADKLVQTSDGTGGLCDGDLRDVQLELDGADFITAMRAAVEATLREPTLAMTTRALEAIDSRRQYVTKGHIDRADVAISWRAAIDALLTEGQKEPGQ